MDGRQKTRAANTAPSKSPWEEKPPPGRGRLGAAPSNGQCQPQEEAQLHMGAVRLPTRYKGGPRGQLPAHYKGGPRGQLPTHYNGGPSELTRAHWRPEARASGTHGFGISCFFELLWPKKHEIPNPSCRASPFGSPF